MREFHRRVVVKGHDEIAIGLGQAQAFQAAQRVPLRGADDDAPRRIRCPDDLQVLGQHLVPDCIHRAMRLVQDLEQHRRRRFAEMRRDLAPEGLQLKPAAGHILGTFLEIVLIENHRQPGLQPCVHQRIKRPQPFRRELVLRVHVREGLQIHPHVVETAVLDGLQVAQLKARLGRVLPERVVADDVDAALERRCVGSRHCRLQADADQQG